MMHPSSAVSDRAIHPGSHPFLKSSEHFWVLFPLTGKHFIRQTQRKKPDSGKVTSTRQACVWLAKWTTKMGRRNNWWTVFFLRPIRKRLILNFWILILRWEKPTKPGLSMLVRVEGIQRAVTQNTATWGTFQHRLTVCFTSVVRAGVQPKEIM